MYLVKPDGVLKMLYWPLRGVSELNGVGRGIMLREREIFKINRGYEELVERLDIERIDYSKCLPCDVTSAVNDDYTDNNKHLPGDKMGVLVTDDDNNGENITYLVMTNNTKVHMTIPNVDKFYEIIMWNNPVNYYYGIVNKTDLDGYYIKKII